MVRIVPDSFSYHLLMGNRVLTDCWSRAYRINEEPYKHSPNQIRKGIRYVSDPVNNPLQLCFPSVGGTKMNPVQSVPFCFTCKHHNLI